MATRYCYWSVSTGPYGALMERCVRSARAAGVFTEFHVLTDRRLDGCECYDAMECDKSDGMFKLHYLKVGMSRLPFDFLVWVDADTFFLRRPMDLLEPLYGSPIHVPLEFNLSALVQDREWNGLSCWWLRDLLRRNGVMNQVYLSESAFWIVHHDAIDREYELSFEFWHAGRAEGKTVRVAAALGYAMQMLCGDPDSHQSVAVPRLWATDYSGSFSAGKSSGRMWRWQHPLGGPTSNVEPALVHVGNRSHRGQEPRAKNCTNSTGPTTTNRFFE